VLDHTTSGGRADAITCPRCQAAMDEVVRIAPLGRSQGLVAYECPRCVYVMSVMLPAG
jgi:hypothetical protein